jgi:hypothetical protein
MAKQHAILPATQVARVRSPVPDGPTISLEKKVDLFTRCDEVASGLRMPRFHHPGIYVFLVLNNFSDFLSIFFSFLILTFFFNP